MKVLSSQILAVTCISCHYLGMICKEEYQNYLCNTKKQVLRRTTLLWHILPALKITANSQTCTGPEFDSQTVKRKLVRAILYCWIMVKGSADLAKLCTNTDANHTFSTFSWFLAAQSSSRSLVIGPSVCLSVCPSVRLSVSPSVSDVCEKVTFRVSNGN